MAVMRQPNASYFSGAYDFGFLAPDGQIITAYEGTKYASANHHHALARLIGYQGVWEAMQLGYVRWVQEDVEDYAIEVAGIKGLRTLSKYASRLVRTPKSKVLFTYWHSPSNADNLELLGIRELKAAIKAELERQTKKQNPLRTSPMIQAFMTSKGVGLIIPDEGRVRGPYTVRVMTAKGRSKTTIKLPNPNVDWSRPLKSRKLRLDDAKAYLRNKLGQLRKGNPSKVMALFEQAEQEGQNWGQRYKRRKGGRMPSNEALYQMGREYSGRVEDQYGPFTIGGREMIAAGYKSGVRRGVRNPGGGIHLSYEDAVSKFGKAAVERQLQWQRGQKGRPLPAIDHSMISPSGRVSARARKATTDRERVRLFGPLGWFVDEPKTSVEIYREKIDQLRRRAKQDREFATLAGKAQAKKLLARADKAEAEADTLEFGKRNPDMQGPALYESFHGKPSTKVLEFSTLYQSRDDYASLGVLVELKVDLVNGQHAVIEFPPTGPDKVMLCSSPDGKQLYFIGGDQSLDLSQIGMNGPEWHRDLMNIGIADEVTYRTRKGFDKFQLIDYYHELGEETKQKPVLLYDTINNELQIAGGQYQVKPEGIVN